MAKKVEKGTLIKDWFGRRAENSFTHKDDSKKLFNWDKNRSSLSSYFVDDNDAVQEAANITASMFKVMGVDKHVTYEKGHSGSNTNRIQLPLGLLKEQAVNPSGEPIEGVTKFIKDMDYEKLDAFYGASLQNAAKYALQSKEEYRIMKANRSRKNQTVKTVFSEILNTERLDKKVAERFPGYIKFIQKFKDYTYDKTYEPLPETASKKEKLMEIIMKMLRYPAHIEESDYIEFKEPLDKIERLLKKFGGIPETGKECTSMATSLSNIVYKYVEKEEEEEKSPGGGPGSDDGEGEGSGSEPEVSKSDLDKSAEEMLKNMMADEESEDFEEKDLDSFSKSMEETGDPAGPKTKINYGEEGYVEPASSITFKKSGTNKTKYVKTRDSIDFAKAQVVRKLFERKSKSYDFSMKGMRSGRLDTAKIAEAVQGVQTVYERIGHVSTNKVCVGVLVDESGSMYGDRIKKAREAAVFINEIFKKMNDVELFIYGHTADTGSGYRTVEIEVYKEPGFQENMYALGNIQARSNNRDGDAILAVGKRIRKLTENPAILFVISDGQPAASGYNGQNGIIDTRNKVTQTQRLGFQVIQIAIDSCVPSDRMFDYFVKMTDIDNLPRELASYMSNKVDKMIKETRNI